MAVARRPDSQKLHIVMDLDSTILESYPVKSLGNINHSNVRKHDHVILDEKYLIWHRPFAHASLWFLNKLFIVHAFTAATKDYGEACLEHFPGIFVNQRLFRESVTNTGSHGKDLSLINTEKDKIVLVDDQARNRTGDQGFYHIPPYTRFVRFDFELPKLCAWAVYWQYQHDRS